MKISEELPKAWADSKALGHVLRNLLSNAVKFTEEGGSVTVYASEREGMVMVCVSDTGIGIAKEQQERIFDRLYQVDSRGTRRYGGTGNASYIMSKWRDMRTEFVYKELYAMPCLRIKGGNNHERSKIRN